MKKNPAQKIKMFDQTELMNKPGMTRQTRYYKNGDAKFAIYYENSNGSPMGFNSKMCLRAYDVSKSKWNSLEDISVLDMSTGIPNYFGVADTKRHMDEFFAKMESHLNRIYG